MINFWNSVLGFLLVVLGIIFIINTAKTKKKIGKDTYGNIIGMYTGAILLIMAGLTLFLRELLKLR
jgi:uncharacterized membrane protein